MVEGGMVEEGNERRRDITWQGWSEGESGGRKRTGEGRSKEGRGQRCEGDEQWREQEERRRSEGGREKAREEHFKGATLRRTLASIQ